MNTDEFADGFAYLKSVARAASQITFQPAQTVAEMSETTLISEPEFVSYKHELESSAVLVPVNQTQKQSQLRIAAIFRTAHKRLHSHKNLLDSSMIRQQRERLTAPQITSLLNSRPGLEQLEKISHINAVQMLSHVHINRVPARVWVYHLMLCLDIHVLLNNEVWLLRQCAGLCFECDGDNDGEKQRFVVWAVVASVFGQLDLKF